MKNKIKGTDHITSFSRLWYVSSFAHKLSIFFRNMFQYSDTFESQTQSTRDLEVKTNVLQVFQMV